MYRRRFIEMISVAGIGTLTGCGSTSNSIPTGRNTPTDRPTPTEQQPTTTQTPTPEPQEFRGQGDGATQAFSIREGVSLLGLRHDGSRNFIAWLLNDQGEKIELLANTIGSYFGVRLLGLPPGQYFIDVSADGPWLVLAQSIDVPTAGKSLPLSANEEGAMFVGPVQFDGATRVAFKGLGQSHYSVWLRNASGEKADLLFNEVGPTREISTVVGTTAVGWITVDTDEAWEMVASSA